MNGESAVILLVLRRSTAAPSDVDWERNLDLLLRWIERKCKNNLSRTRMPDMPQGIYKVLLKSTVIDTNLFARLQIMIPERAKEVSFTRRYSEKYIINYCYLI